MIAVRVCELGRIYEHRRRRVVALDNFSLEIEENEIHGLLGPNGAGKSTLIKILTTVLLPTSGSAYVLEHDVVKDLDRVRAVIGLVLGGERGLYNRVSARQNLQFWAALYKIHPSVAQARAEALLERFGLVDRADEPVERFSRGMKQRLHLARGLLHAPQVLFLDEPTSGLDPVAANGFRNFIHELRDEGHTILLATHDMNEAAAMCDRVSLIDRGKLLLTGATLEVSQLFGNQMRVDYACADPGLADDLAALPFVLSVDKADGVNQWRAHPVNADGIADILRWLLDRGVLSARRSEPTLEEVYLNAIGKRGMNL
jgi:ABC-2 type transport system ATP-binding protein